MAEVTRIRPGELVLHAVDAAVEHKWPGALERASGLGGGTVEERVNQLQKSFNRELATIGAAAGGISAVPGVGTVAGVAVAAGELAVLTSRAADLILTVGALHGHSTAVIEQRRAWVLSVLLFGETASSGFTRVAGEVGKGLGAKATKAIPVSTLRAINRAMGRTIITKYGTKRGAIALGRLLPFGIGAVIGGTANYAMIRMIGGQADRFFSDLPAVLHETPSPDDSAVTGHDLAHEVPANEAPELEPSADFSTRERPTPEHPKALADPSVIDERETLVDAPHVRPLNTWVRGLRSKMPESIVPWFDPLDGGVNARILWLLETPGPKATRERGGSGFVSADNNDNTAANTFEFMASASVDRKDVVLWNAVPYYLGDGKRISPVTSDDIAAVGPLLGELLDLLPELRAVILGGKAAQRTWSRHSPSDRSDLTIIECPHPSPQNVNTRPQARQQIIDAWSAARDVVEPRAR